jgi:hypothetical protein
VYLNGSIQQTATTDCEAGTLPAAARPTHWLYLPLAAEGLPYAVLRIGPDGSMCIWSNGQGIAVWADLGGVAYQVGA